MKIYRVTFHDDHMGAVLTWHSSRRSAERELAKYRRDERELPEIQRSEMEVHKINIPTTRKGLIAWLNRNFQSDNG